MGKGSVVYIPSAYEILFSHFFKKEIFSDNMDEPWGRYSKWNKPEKERQIPYLLLNMWNLKKLDLER